VVILVRIITIAPFARKQITHVFHGAGPPSAHPTDDTGAQTFDEQNYDPAKPWTRYPIGYPRFAAFMSNDEDKSTTIFRRFERLSARNLLYLESELTELEAKQDQLDAESRRNEDLELSMQSWDLLCLQATPYSKEGKERIEESAEEERLRLAAQERLQLAWRIREVLKEYRKFISTEEMYTLMTGLRR